MSRATEGYAGEFPRWPIAGAKSLFPRLGWEAIRKVAESIDGCAFHQFKCSGQ